MRLQLALPSPHERLVGESIVVKEIEIFRCFRWHKFGTTWVTPYGMTLCEETDAFTKQKGGEGRTVQTNLTDDCRVLQYLLAHHPQHLSRLVAI